LIFNEPISKENIMPVLTPTQGLVYLHNEMSPADHLGGKLPGAQKPGGLEFRHNFESPDCDTEEGAYKIRAHTAYILGKYMRGPYFISDDGLCAPLGITAFDRRDLTTCIAFFKPVPFRRGQPSVSGTWLSISGSMAKNDEILWQRILLGMPHEGPRMRKWMRTLADQREANGIDGVCIADVMDELCRGPLPGKSVRPRTHIRAEGEIYSLQ
jgi:hypothetical protein